ncbi:MAG: MYXO-CTERM sorting domain-containing protein [bacterium]
MCTRRLPRTVAAKSLFALVIIAVTSVATPARAGYDETFGPGSLIIPMDLAYQDTGMFQSYGLVFQLLRNGVRVYWVIEPDKTWHHAACDTAGDECAWDCAEEGTGIKCPYPTASPDFYAAAEVVWDSEGVMNAGDPIVQHGYRGGPFVIAAADAAAALPIIDAWNDQALWTANPWAERTVFHVVTVHRVTADFHGYVRKEMIAAPTIAVFSDGNEDIATGYLRAAGIPQSNGTEFPAARCGGAGTCGPGTPNPDMLTVESIMGDMGTCDNPNADHKNGALFTPDGIPAYCQIMSMHWGVNDRETVECDGGGCPATQAECAGETFTYHGHEVVAEVRQFLMYPTHFFAECQAVNAYENTSPNPAWPFLDDTDRNGHFLTTTGDPPDCPCTDADFECVTLGCDGGTRDCCLPSNIKELGAGFMIADQPDENTLQILHPEVPYNQLDGAFGTVGGSEPAYNLSDYLGTEYQNNMDVTFITGPNGPGEEDVWMTGFMDGTCSIGNDDVQPGQCTFGKVSYLGGHSYSTNVPLSGNIDGQGCRVFLNALFEADCVTSLGQPNISLNITGRESLGVQTLPGEERYTVGYVNLGQGVALDAVLTVTLPTGSAVSDLEAGGSEVGSTVVWDIGSIGGLGGQPGDPGRTGSRWLDLSFLDYGDYTLEAILDYRVGVSDMQTLPVELTVHVAADSDGDTIPDDLDPFPNDPFACGDSDNDTCDDCSVTGSFDPADDGPDTDGDGICDAGEGADAGGHDGPAEDPGCGCRSTGAGQGAPAAVVLLLLLLVAIRRRRA